MIRLITLVLCLWSGAAGAAVMGFNFPPLYGNITVWVEDGITANSGGGGYGNYIASHGRPGTVHLDDSGTVLAGGLAFTTGGLFDAVSFDLFALPNMFSRWVAYPNGGQDREDGMPGYYAEFEYDNVLLEGWRGGNMVASDTFWMSTMTYAFSDAFSGIDTLIIAAVFPPNYNGGTDNCSFPCNHFDIDNITLGNLRAKPDSDLSPSPVPLPPTILLLASALGGLGLWSRRQLNHPASPN